MKRLIVLLFVLMSLVFTNIAKADIVSEIDASEAYSVKVKEDGTLQKKYGLLKIRRVLQIHSEISFNLSSLSEKEINFVSLNFHVLKIRREGILNLNYLDSNGNEVVVLEKLLNREKDNKTLISLDVTEAIKSAIKNEIDVITFVLRDKEDLVVKFSEKSIKPNYKNIKNTPFLRVSYNVPNPEITNISNYLEWNGTELCILNENGELTKCVDLKGDVGENGIDGKDGKDGLNGKDGKDGLNGKDGATGPMGPKGDPGTCEGQCENPCNSDLDNDSVSDCYDLCPDTLEGITVDDYGCCTGKVVICHKGYKCWNTIEVSCNALESHLDHGDYIGTCNSD